MKKEILELTQRVQGVTLEEKPIDEKEVKDLEDMLDDLL